MAVGYLYVLLNASLPGLVKVGMTTRTPQMRAQELSSTGLPTPYLVAFQVSVGDCALAEQRVHTLLTNRGFRETENREFFRADVSDVIRMILQVSEMTDLATSEASTTDIDSNDLADPWEKIEDEAFAAYVGRDDTFIDHVAALRLYEQAVLLGSPSACWWAGEMHADGEGTAVNESAAIRLHRLGADRGYADCFSALGHIWATSENNANRKNATLAYMKYIDALSNNQNTPEGYVDAVLAGVLSKILRDGVDHDPYLLARIRARPGVGQVLEAKLAEADDIFYKQYYSKALALFRNKTM